MKEGYYWLTNVQYKETSLVYYYKNPDTDQYGFGFNIRDGCGFLPERDLTEETIVTYAGYELVA